MRRNIGINATGPEDLELTEEEHAAMLEEMQAQNPFAPASAAPKVRIKPKASGKKKAEEPATYDQQRVYPAASASVMAALAVPAAERTLAQVQLLKERREIEEQAIRAGGRIDGGGIFKTLRAEEIGKEEAGLALAYYAAQEREMAKAGRAPDGSKLPEGAPTTAAAGSQGGKVQVQPPKGEVALAQPSRPKQPGWAMRVMADGKTVKVASGLNASGGSNITDYKFDTKEAALAFYQSPKFTQPAQQGDQQPAQPAGGVGITSPGPAQAPTGSMVDDAKAFFSGRSGSPAAPAAPAAPVNPAAEAAKAKTTSQTAQLGMGGTSVPTTPAKISPQATAPKPDTSKIPTSELFAQATGAPASPGVPSVGFGTAASSIASRVTARTPWGQDLNAVSPGGLYARDPVKLGKANREIVGIPSRAGYQKSAEDLDPMRARVGI